MLSATTTFQLASEQRSVPKLSFSYTLSCGLTPRSARVLRAAFPAHFTPEDPLTSAFFRLRPTIAPNTGPIRNCLVARVLSTLTGAGEPLIPTASWRAGLCGVRSTDGLLKRPVCTTLPTSHRTDPCGLGQSLKELGWAAGRCHVPVRLYVPLETPLRLEGTAHGVLLCAARAREVLPTHIYLLMHGAPISPL